MARRGGDQSHKDPWGFGLERLPPSGKIPCLECGTATTGKHHVVPKVRGGQRQIPMCGVCHAKVHNMSQRQLIREGLSKQIGLPKKKKTTKKTDMKIISLRKSGMPYKKIAKKLRLSVGTIYSRINAEVPLIDD